MAEIFGVEFAGEPQPGELVESVVVIAEIVDPDGKKRLGLFASEPMAVWQQYGVLMAAAFSCETELRDSWEDGP